MGFFSNKKSVDNKVTSIDSYLTYKELVELVNKDEEMLELTPYALSMREALEKLDNVNKALEEESKKEPYDSFFFLGRSPHHNRYVTYDNNIICLEGVRDIRLNKKEHVITTAKMESSVLWFRDVHRASWSLGEYQRELESGLAPKEKQFNVDYFSAEEKEQFKELCKKYKYRYVYHVDYNDSVILFTFENGDSRKLTIRNQFVAQEIFNRMRNFIT